MTSPSSLYWDKIADHYQHATRIACDDFHYGPLLPGDRELGLLPADLHGAQVLEIGCGAGQNSIFLASRGAHGVALDSAPGQLKHGVRLARQHGVTVDFVQADMSRMPTRRSQQFDLIHSAYALAFAEDQETVIHAAVERLRPGGTFICSTAHPLFTAEWIELEDGAQGIFLPDYFQPRPDSRHSAHGGDACCQPVPVSRVVEWLVAGGMVIEHLLEPAPLPIHDMDEDDLRRVMPYDSQPWRDMYDEMVRVPTVIIYVATKR